MRTGHLFAGAGGGILADIILGHTPIFAVEMNKYAANTLRKKVSDGWINGMHVYECDIKLFNSSKYKGRVDCIHAGFPCQDISFAGTRHGVEKGERSNLYKEALRVAREIEPRYIFLENVPAITSVDRYGQQPLERVMRDIAGIGYDAAWICLSASDCGAPHKRERWWCLAECSDNNSKRKLQQEGGQQKSGNGLATYVKLFPTPTASMKKGASKTSMVRKDGKHRANGRLDYYVMYHNGGKLNPAWGEWLMGWPTGWLS